MNCQLCQKKSDAYREDKLSPDMRTQVEEHLQHCTDCAESYNLQSLAQKIINQEKAISPDPYLTTRIMARIENPGETDYRAISPLSRVLKPALIMTSMAAAMIVGVIIGDIYKPSSVRKSIPVELSLINDAAIESIDLLSNE